MTTEERFKKLLEIACDNGYVHDKMTIDIDKDLNNLILNTNFFECLLKDSPINFEGEVFTKFWVLGETEKYTNMEMLDFTNVTPIQFMKFEWILEVERGTALEWLFKQFGI